MSSVGQIIFLNFKINKIISSWIQKINDAVECATKNCTKRTLSETVQKVLRSDSRGQLDMAKPVDLKAVGQAIISQTKLIEECFQNSQVALRNSEQCNNVDVDNFSTSIHTLTRLVSQLTVKFH